MHQGVIRWGIMATVLALSACTTPPPGEPSPPSDASTSGTAPRVPGKMPASALATLPDPAPLPAMPREEDELLAGEAPREFEQGKASWYGPRFNGRRTASGERYNMHELTAAHKTLPFGTVVRVRSLVNGKEVDVRITDRGPFSRGRVIDLSRAAAEAIGMLGLGVKDVLLLVPESTPAVVQAPPPATKRPRIVRRAPSPR
ncbi:MAG: septal ring lytic transglycosylase RlpA family protein [Pseudomonadota bacterium]